MGELTDVASAKRAVRGVLRESAEDDSDDVLDRVTVTVGPFFSSDDENTICDLDVFDIALFENVR